ILTYPPRSTLFPYTTLFRSYTEKISIIGFVMVTLIGFIWYQSKTFKRTFTKPKNLAKVLGIAVLGMLGMSYLLSPNIYEKHNRRSEEHTSELQSRENLVCRL